MAIAHPSPVDFQIARVSCWRCFFLVSMRARRVPVDRALVLLVHDLPVLCSLLMIFVTRASLVLKSQRTNSLSMRSSARTKREKTLVASERSSRADAMASLYALARLLFLNGKQALLLTLDSGGCKDSQGSGAVT
jgi:hypothetical protein